MMLSWVKRCFAKGDKMTGAILFRDVMTRNVKTVIPSSPVMGAIQKMNKFRIGSVIVIQGGRPVGIITGRDILRRVEVQLDPSVVKAREIMSTPIITVDEDTPVEDASRTMTRRQIKKLPVVRDGRLVGIVTATDIARSAPQLVNLLRSLMRKRVSSTK